MYQIPYFKNDIFIKSYFVLTILIFFLFLLKIISLEKCIYSLKHSLNLNEENIDYTTPLIDKDLIGLTYPDILFDEFKKNLTKGSLKKTFYNFLNQLHIKLIYLEKEINVTKLFSFYSIRTSYLDKRHIKYNDEKILRLNDIVNWATIHKSTQLKGIASDKYLACKYVQLKLGENLCQQRKRVYDNFEDINFTELINKGNVVLKTTTGCHDLVFIRNNTKDIKEIKQRVKHYFQKDYGLSDVPEFFHLFSKKRIIEETIFEPMTDLYEFKIFVVNREIKFFLVNFQIGDKLLKNFYDLNYNLMNFSDSRLENFDIISTFGIEILNKLKDYAYRLSEDFKNFIRVDLYVFHKKIYLSELTFDSWSGYPIYGEKKIIIDAGKNFTKYD